MHITFDMTRRYQSTYGVIIPTGYVITDIDVEAEDASMSTLANSPANLADAVESTCVFAFSFSLFSICFVFKLCESEFECWLYWLLMLLRARVCNDYQRSISVCAHFCTSMILVCGTQGVSRTKLTYQKLAHTQSHSIYKQKLLKLTDNYFSWKPLWVHRLYQHIRSV